MQFLLEGSPPVSTIGAGAVDLTSPVRPQQVTPEFYQELSAKLTAAAGTALPWSSWLRREERLGLREGFPDQVLAGDLDGGRVRRAHLYPRQAS